MASVIPKEVKKETVDLWLLETWKVCLLTHDFTYVTTTHVFYEDLTFEVPNGNGYVTGGATVSRSPWDVDSGYTGTDAKIDAADTSWSGATFATVRFAVVYETTGKKIRAIYEFDGDKSVTSGTFTIQWNAGGLIKIS